MRTVASVVARIVIFGVVVLALAVVFFAQTPTLPAPQTPSQYQTTEIQQLRLKVKYQEAQMLNRDLLDAQTRLNKSITELQEMAEKVKEENHWPKDVGFNMMSCQTSCAFTPPLPPVKADPPKKEEPKKP